MQNDEDRKPKRYKTYKSGRGRRTSLDDELAGARPERRSRATEKRAPEERGARDYSRYGSASSSGRGSSSRDAKGKKPRRRFRWRRFFAGCLIALIVAGVAVTVLAWPGYNTFDRAVDKANARLDKQAAAALDPDEGWIVRKPTTILLLGTDSKAGEPARSDTIMLMRFIPSTRHVNQLSIPRDTRLEIPDLGYDKINAAMFWDEHAPHDTIEAVSDYLGIEINHVMVVNFKGFPRLVNAVGGVDMYVPETISTIAGSQGRVVTYEKGMQHFDGKNAMLYVRIRKADSDFMRAKRQQQFIQALQKKLMKPSNILNLPMIGKRFMSGVTTDLTTTEILAIAFDKWRAKGGTKQVMVGDPALIGGVSYVLPPSDSEKAKIVRRFLGE